jgi:hypothetical protein
MNFDDTARFLGPSEKLSPELFAAPSKKPTMLCRNCRKVVVRGIRRYCERCALKRKLASTRESKRAKAGLNGRKTKIRRFGLRHLQKRKPQTAMRTLRPQFLGVVFLPRAKRIHRLSRRRKRVSK